MGPNHIMAKQQQKQQQKPKNKNQPQQGNPNRRRRQPNLQAEIQQMRMLNLERNSMRTGDTSSGQFQLSRPGGFQTLMSTLGNTVEGQRWAMTSLDPCGPIPDNMGIPDSSGAPVATPTYRGEGRLAYDTSMFATAPTTPTLYSIEIAFPPIPEIEFMYRIYDIASGVWSYTRVIRKDGYDISQGLNISSNTAAGTTLKTVGYGKVRVSGSGRNFELDAPDIANQGRVTVGQVEAVMEIITSDAYAGQSATPGALQTQDSVQYCALRLPNSSRFLVNGCPNAYQSEAKNGAYVPRKFTGALAAQQYKITGGGGAIQSNPDLTGTWYITPDTFMAVYYSDGPVTESEGAVSGRFLDDSSLYGAFTGTTGITTSLKTANGWLATHVHPAVTMPTDMLTPVIFFEGLTVGTSTQTGASVRVKSRDYLECISTGAGAISPFVHRSPVLDQRAIDVVCTIGQMGADAYPSSYNDFGDMLRAIWNGVKTVATPLLGVTSAIPGIGGVVSKLGLGALSALDRAINPRTVKDIPLD